MSSMHSQAFSCAVAVKTAPGCLEWTQGDGRVVTIQKNRDVPCMRGAQAKVYRADVIEQKPRLDPLRFSDPRGYVMRKTAGPRATAQLSQITQWLGTLRSLPHGLMLPACPTFQYQSQKHPRRVKYVTLFPDGGPDLCAWDWFEPKKGACFRTYAQRLLAWRNMAELVADCHARDILHGDLKPENFVRSELTQKFSLVDLNTVQRISAFRYPQRGGDSRQLLGTIQYMSPESIAAQTENLASIRRIARSVQSMMPALWPALVAAAMQHSGKIQLRGDVNVTKNTDVWAMGCMLLQVYHLYTPAMLWSESIAYFIGQDSERHNKFTALSSQTQAGIFEMGEALCVLEWDVQTFLATRLSELPVSHPAQDPAFQSLVGAMLHPDPSRRISMPEALAHDFWSLRLHQARRVAPRQVECQVGCCSFLRQLFRVV